VLENTLIFMFRITEHTFSGVWISWQGMGPAFVLLLNELRWRVLPTITRFTKACRPNCASRTE